MNRGEFFASLFLLPFVLIKERQPEPKSKIITVSGYDGREVAYVNEKGEWIARDSPGAKWNDALHGIYPRINGQGDEPSTLMRHEGYRPGPLPEHISKKLSGGLG